MTEKKIQPFRKLGAVLPCAVFCLMLFAMLLLLLFLPKEDYSQLEKRYLAAAPEWDLRSVLSGRFAEQAEAYIADHLPGRLFLLGLNAKAERAVGRQPTKSIYVGKSGRLYEAPCRCDTAIIERNMEAINTFAALTDAPVHLMLVPSAGYILRRDIPAFHATYLDDGIIRASYALGQETLETVDLLTAFDRAEEKESFYYRTDHHWTSEGAYCAYRLYAQAVGRPVKPREVFSVTTVPGFLGTTYSRSALWDTPAESIALWKSATPFLVENSEAEGRHEGLFYEDALSDPDKYPVFLDGNHALLRVHNGSAAASGRLLVIRDSFASCLGCFLAEAYEEVVMVDLRYYKAPVADLLADGDFDEILILYSVGNFMTDSNITRLAGY